MKKKNRGEIKIRFEVTILRLKTYIIFILRNMTKNLTFFFFYFKPKITTCD